MPVVLLEEVENLFKCLVGDVNVFAVKCLKLMLLKDTAIEVRDFTEQAFYISVPFIFRFGEPFKEEWTEEFFVVAVGAIRFDSLLVWCDR